MYKVTKYPQGTFSWADNASTDASNAKAFYEGLFGWDKDEVPMSDTDTYTMFKQDGSHTVGLAAMQKEQLDMGIPSHWMSYITVDDVDAMVAKVKDNGGTVIAGPYDVFESGRMMVIQDPTGAMVSLWQPKNHIGAGVVNAPGAMLWNELATRDVEKAKEFYGNVLGWTYQLAEGDYPMIMNNGRANGGILQMDDSWGDMPPSWMVYFNVSDLDKSLEKVSKLGGNVIMGKTSAGDIGEFAVVSDSAGAVFTIMQASNAEAWVE